MRDADDLEALITETAESLNPEPLFTVRQNVREILTGRTS